MIPQADRCQGSTGGGSGRSLCRTVGVAALLAAAAGLCGCGKGAEPARTRPAEDEARREDAKELPAVDAELAEGASPILVKPLPAGVKRDSGYVQVEKMPAGDILGLCYIPTPVPLKLPAGGKVDITNGRDRIRDAEPKELEYYKKVDLARPRWVHAHSRDQGGHPVSGAVIMVRGVQVGLRDPLPRGKFFVNNGELRPRIGFSPVNDRVELRTYDAFSNHFVVRDVASGETLLEKVLPGNTAEFRGHGAMDKEHLIAWSWTQWTRLAKPVQTDPVRRKGFFEITCKRHPWQRAYAVVFDSPYLAVPASRHKQWGIFRLTRIPAGTWTVEVWHPVLEPVKRTLTVRIKADETLELPIRFNPPPEARPPKPGT